MNAVQLDRIRRVLVIKWSALGDVVTASALMEDIAQALPHADIHLNTQPNCAGLFAHDPRFPRCGRSMCVVKNGAGPTASRG